MSQHRRFYTDLGLLIQEEAWEAIAYIDLEFCRLRCEILAYQLEILRCELCRRQSSKQRAFVEAFSPHPYLIE